MSLKRFGVLVGIAATCLGLLAGVARAAWSLDARYAKAHEIAQLSNQMDRLALEIRIGQLETRLEGLRAERFQRALAAKRGHVTDDELLRLEALNAQIDRLQTDLNRLDALRNHVR